VPAGQLGSREWDGLQEALSWLQKTSISISRNYDLSVDSVNSEARKHLAAVETFENAFAASGMQLFPEARDRIGFFHLFVTYWRDAAAECAALGLGGDISCPYYGRHIELPEAVIMATKWFDTAEKLTPKVDVMQLLKLQDDGYRHINAVEACRSSWPQARVSSIERRFVKWMMLAAKWDHMEALIALDRAKEKKKDVATVELFTRQLERARESLKETSHAFFVLKMDKRVRKADMLKKRTCYHCGKTGPLSQKSFAYCGGCRHSGVARIDLPRYCSEACQRAHWAAGHKDECPCAKDL